MSIHVFFISCMSEDTHCVGYSLNYMWRVTTNWKEIQQKDIKCNIVGSSKLNGITTLLHCLHFTNRINQWLLKSEIIFVRDKEYHSTIFRNVSDLPFYVCYSCNLVLLLQTFCFYAMRLLNLDTYWV